MLFWIFIYVLLEKGVCQAGWVLYAHLTVSAADTKCLEMTVAICHFHSPQSASTLKLIMLGTIYYLLTYLYQTGAQAKYYTWSFKFCNTLWLHGILKTFCSQMEYLPWFDKFTLGLFFSHTILYCTCLKYMHSTRTSSPTTAKCNALAVFDPIY